MVAIRCAAAAAVLLVVGAFHLRPGSVLAQIGNPYLILFPPNLGLYPIYGPPLLNYPLFLSSNIPTSAPSWAITPPNVSDNIPMNCPPQSVIQAYLSGQTVNGTPAIPAACLPAGVPLPGTGALRAASP